MTGQAIIDFTSYINERTRDFTGREWLFAKLDHWLADPTGPSMFILTGEPGIGKTAIAARLTQIRDLAAIHFCNARNGGWINPDGFIRSISAQLANRYPTFGQALSTDLHLNLTQTVETNYGTVIGTQITNYYAETPEALFHTLVRRPLQAICSGSDLDEPLIILVDSLDEALAYTGRITIPRLLATNSDLPPQVRYILTSRPVETVLTAFRHLQPFILYAQSAENQADLRIYLRHRFNASSRLQTEASDLAQRDRVIERLAERSSGNFLVISKVLDGIEQGELNLSDPNTLPADLQELYAWFLDRLTRQDWQLWRNQYRPVLATLAAAQEAIDTITLSRWLDLSYQSMIDTLHDLREFLDPTLLSQARLYHQSVADFLAGDQGGIYATDLTEYHQKINQYYTRQFGPGRASWTECDLYGLRHLPFHLIQAGQVETLRQLLFQFDWLQAKLNIIGINSIIADYNLVLPPTEISDRSEELIYNTLRLSTHALAQDPGQLATQLLGRLLTQSHPKIQALLEQAKETSPSPWFRPLIASLVPPGGLLVRTLTGHTGWVNGVTITPDGKRLISASDDGALKVWDLEQGTELTTLSDLTDRMATVTDRIAAVVVTPDGKRVISTAWYDLKVWDLNNGLELTRLEGHTDCVVAIAVVPNGEQIISASSDYTLKVWDLSEGTELMTLRGHTDRVTAVAITLDGKRAISASEDNTLKVWDIDSGLDLMTFVGHTDDVMAVAVTSDDSRCVSASRDGTLKVWDLGDGKELMTLTGHSIPITAVVITPDDKYIISAAGDGEIKIWSLDRGKKLTTFISHGIYVRALAVTPDGRQLVSASEDHTLKVWNLDNKGITNSFIGHTDRVTTIAITPDGKQAISTSWNTPIKVWNLNNGTECYTFANHVKSINQMAITPDGKRIIYAPEDHTLKIWDLNNRTELATLTGHTDRVTRLAIIRDGMVVISSSSDGTIKIWDLKRNIEISSLTNTNWFDLILVTPDNKWITYVPRDNIIVALGPDNETKYCSLIGHTDRISIIAVTPNEKQAISASWDSTLKIWDLDSGVELGTLTGHTSFVNKVAITMDGRRAISTSFDRTLKVWDLNSYQCLATFTGEASLEACAVALDGVTIVAGEASGRMHFLRLEGIEPLPIPLSPLLECSSKRWWQFWKKDVS